MARERSGLAGYALHQVTIPADGVDIEIENVEAGAIEILRQPFTGNGHSHTVSRALSERPGRRLHSGRQVRFRMAGSAAVNLPEAFDFFHRNGKLTGHLALGIDRPHSSEMQRRIKQHGGVASR